MAVDVETDPTFRAGTPRLLFDGGFLTGVGRVPVYDLTADGQRFLMVQIGDQAEGRRISAPGHGTLIRVTLPVRGSEEGA